MWYRETMIWRFTELAQEALDNFNRKHFAAGIVLTRAAVETAAGLWYLHTKIMKAIKGDSLGDLHEVLRRLNVGYKDPSAHPSRGAGGGLHAVFVTGLCIHWLHSAGDHEGLGPTTSD